MFNFSPPQVWLNARMPSFSISAIFRRSLKLLSCCGRSLGTCFSPWVDPAATLSQGWIACCYGGRKARKMEIVLLSPGKQWAENANAHTVCGLQHPRLQKERGTKSKHGAQHQEMWSSHWPCFGLGWVATTWFLSISPSAKKYEKYLPHMED